MRIAISGVSRGIGEGLARAALASGDAVLGFGRTEPSWAGDIAAFRLYDCDMADPDSIADACGRVAGPIDVLVCNAATFADGAGSIEWFDPAALSAAFSINTIAPLVMARGLKRQLESGDRRLIVMMSTGNASLAGNTTGTLLAYRLSKTALNQAVRTLAAEWAAEGFSIVALNPGWVRTDMGGPDAEISVDQAADEILGFIRSVAVNIPVNGLFLNTDGSQLPW